MTTSLLCLVPIWLFVPSLTQPRSSSSPLILHYGQEEGLVDLHYKSVASFLALAPTETAHESLC